MADDLSDQVDDASGDAAGRGERGLSLFSLALWGPDGPPEGVIGRDDRDRCPDDDGHDDGCWGHVSPIRAPVAIPPPNMLISREDMQAIAAGYAPMDMNDKWFAFMDDNRLFLHRSWTGYGIYEVRFAAKESGFVATSAWIESDPGRQRGDFDPQDFDPIAERDDLRDLIVHVSGDPMPPLLPTVVSRGPVLEVVLGDIADQEVDAVVNSANKALSAGSGVNGAIHSRAGPELEAHCATLGGCAVGEAKVTPGFGLAAEWVIHTVVPRWHDGTDGEPLLLGWCYQACLAMADEMGAESVAFPALGAGARGFSPEDAAWIAVVAARAAPTEVRTIRFVCYDGPTYTAFQAAVQDED